MSMCVQISIVINETTKVNIHRGVYYSILYCTRVMSAITNLCCYRPRDTQYSNDVKRIDLHVRLCEKKLHAQSCSITICSILSNLYYIYHTHNSFGYIRSRNISNNITPRPKSCEISRK